MTDKLPLTGRTALVTGASSGIGHETAAVLARDGADVAVAARREERLQTLADDIENRWNQEALVLPTDVTDSSQVEAMVEETISTFGGLDIVVCNAGIIHPGGVDLSDADYHAMTDVNTDGMFYTTRATVPHLRETSGNIIFIGSYAGKNPIPGAPVYAATKWWTRGFAHSIAGAEGQHDVAVTVVNPSTVRSEFGSAYREPNTEKFEPGTVTESIDVAEAISFAAQQDKPNTVSELDLFKRDKFA